MMQNNSEKYKWGLFYFDREDSRIFVPKMYWVRGWTLNFGNPISYFVIAVLIAVIVLIAYYN